MKLMAVVEFLDIIPSPLVILLLSIHLSIDKLSILSAYNPVSIIPLQENIFLKTFVSFIIGT